MRRDDEAMMKHPLTAAITAIKCLYREEKFHCRCALCSNHAGGAFFRPAIIFDERW